MKTKKRKKALFDMANRIRCRLFALENQSNKNKMRRYFREGDYNGLGISNAVVYTTINTIQKSDDRYLDTENVILICEDLLSRAKYSEERLAVFSLLIKVTKQLEPNFLSRFKYWLENYVTTWAECDVLCLKTIYHFLLRHINLIPNIQKWTYSDSNWCRRASNVVMIKFLSRKIDKETTYRIDKKLVFDNCLALIHDTDTYVQKSIGWLLKGASVFYVHDIMNFLMINSKDMMKSTMKTAMEKIDKSKKHQYGVSNRVL